jgi:DNA-binding response OmpR family regulator
VPLVRRCSGEGSTPYQLGAVARRRGGEPEAFQVGAVLVAEGYVVIPAVDGQQAIQLAASTTVDLVLLDLNMPVKNGWDTFERLSCEHPLVPVIIVTARANQWFTALGAGVGALLEKPMDIEALLQTITHLLTESNEVRLKRLAGQSADFFYNTGQMEQPRKADNC